MKMMMRDTVHASFRTALAAILLAAAGCAEPYADAIKKFESASPCCESLAELPFRLLAVGDRMAVDVTGETPAYLFSSGKSTFAAFELPPYTGPYRILVDSYLLKDGMDRAAIFLPVVMTLDEEHDVVRSFSPDFFRPASKGLAASAGIPHALTGAIEVGEENSGERYLVILSRRELIGAWISSDPPGGGERARIRSVPVGKLLIRLERIAS